MIFIQLLLILLIIIAAWPLGRFISKQVKEELQEGKKWFYLICFLCMIGIAAGLFLLKGDEMILAESILDFIFLLSLASIYEANKSRRK
jgi:Na+/melibiose symporter-like transporter